jgi:hypothetical protein
VYRYVVWDAYSAGRSPTFAAKELELVRKYGGRVVHTERASYHGVADQQVVVVYEITTPPSVSAVRPPGAPVPVAVPNRVIIYAAYSLALIGVLAVVLWAAVGGRRRRPDEGGEPT